MCKNSFDATHTNQVLTFSVCSRILSECSFIILLSLLLRQCTCRFATDFNCKENKQPPAYEADVKSFVKGMANHLNRRDQTSLDLSTIGLGFVKDGNFLTRNYLFYLSLDLSVNVIKKIEPKLIRRFPNIQALDLSQNCLTSLEIHDRLSFTRLQSLNLSRNLIAQVHPFTFANLSLDILDLSHNRLIRFLIADYEVNQLYLNHNQISQVEIDSRHFKELKLFDASNNKIRMFQVSVDFDNLILSSNHLTLDEYFSIRSVYGTLDLSKNHISEFDWKIISCVTNLNLSNNRMSILQLECPSKRFAKMEKLNLDKNFLCSFEESSSIKVCLPNLKFISLLSNRFTTSGKIKIKSNLSSLSVKSQIYDYEFFSQTDNDKYKDFDIFH